MRNFDEHNITDAALDRFRDTPDARLKQIMTSLVQHLHDFVRDIELTFEEWELAINFLTRTGQISTNKRQEFILLSDTLGVSMLIDAINHRMPAGATETTVLGPFYVQEAPELPNGSDLSQGLEGEPLYVEGSVEAADGTRLANAIIDVWNSDKDGYYDVQRPDLDEPTLRARFRANADGRFRFWSIQPASYPIPSDGPVGQMLAATRRHPYRPAHVHFRISAEGYETLITHVFVAGDRYLDSDAVFGVKDALISDFKREAPGVGPDGRAIPTSWRRLTYRFGLKPLTVDPAATTDH